MTPKVKFFHGYTNNIVTAFTTTQRRVLSALAVNSSFTLSYPLHLSSVCICVIVHTLSFSHYFALWALCLHAFIFMSRKIAKMLTKNMTTYYLHLPRKKKKKNLSKRILRYVPISLQEIFKCIFRSTQPNASYNTLIKIITVSNQCRKLKSFTA